MKTKIQTTILAALLCVTFTAELHAQLPNAWQINDNTTSSGVNQYIVRLTTEQAGYAHSDGWRYDVVSRMVSGTAGTASHSMAFGDGTHRYYIFFDLNASGQLTAELLGSFTNYLYTLTSAAQGTNYHTHELTYDPLFGNVTYRFDGNVVATWVGSVSTGQSNQVMWGANSSAGTGVMNYHRAEFSIIGQGVIASYDAGFAGNPATAPAPDTQGWSHFTSGATIPDSAVSPDLVSFPPLVTALSATDVTANTATVHATINPYGLAAAYYWEYGLTTNYGNLTVTNTLPAGLGATSVSADISGLSPGTTWHFRCVASNAAGITFGEDMVITPLTVTTLADSGPGSLRQTIAETHRGGAITFATNGVIPLTSGELLITKDLSFTGPGSANLAIDAGFQFRVMEISNASVTLDGLTVRKGELSAGDTNSVGGGILLESNAVLALNNCTVSDGRAYNGGGIANEGGVLAMTTSTVSGNIASSSGGGIFCEGALTLDNCTLSANSISGSGSGWGGGVFNKGTLTISHCTFSYNSLSTSASGGGGGIFSDGALMVAGSTISHNSARYSDGGGLQSTNGTITIADTAFFDDGAYYGGAIAIESGVAAIGHSSFSTNYAEANGGCILNHGALTINDSTLSGNSADAVLIGGGGGIYNDGSLAVNRSALLANFAKKPDYGGGIYNDSSGMITITNSILSQNAAGGNGGGVVNNAGGTVSVANSTFSGNSAYNGGGISNEGSNTLSQCTFADNTAAGPYGGGIYNGGTLAVADSTFSGNIGYPYGGAINNYGTLAVANSTFWGNSARAGNYNSYGYGGGIYNTGTNRLNNCTFSSNTASYGGGIENLGGGILTLTNTIVAGNLANSSPDILGSFSGANNLTNGVPLLAPLGNYGGPTQAAPPLAGSPAIDAGRDSVTAFFATDQRGYPRKFGAHVDIGAVELQGAVASNPPLLLNPATPADGSLTFGFTNIASAEFTVLASTNVALPVAQWSNLGLAAQAAPGLYQFADPGATNYPQRFYQVISP